LDLVEIGLGVVLLDRLNRPQCVIGIALRRFGQPALVQCVGSRESRLAVTVTTRNTPAYRDPSVLLIDQLKEIYIDGTLNAIDTTQWYPIVMRKDYAIGLTVSENGLDDPDQQFYENFSCGAERNYTGHCNARSIT
jgi:hypothetical protein